MILNFNRFPIFCVRFFSFFPLDRYLSGPPSIFLAPLNSIYGNVAGKCIRKEIVWTDDIGLSMYLNVHHKWFSFHRILIYASESFEHKIDIFHLLEFNIRYARMPSVFATSACSINNVQTIDFPSIRVEHFFLSFRENFVI